MVRPSSLEAYAEVKATGKAGNQEQAILDWLTQVNRAVSRRQIHAGTGIETSTVSARVNALIKRGAVHESAERYPCPITGIRVHLVELPKYGQLRLV